jgi:hypothetical protein
MRITPKEMALAAKEVLSIPPRKESAQDKIFRSFFGAPIGVITDIGTDLKNHWINVLNQHIFFGELC